MLKNIFFDLDGTLINHFSAILRCINLALSRLKRKPLSKKDYAPFVGSTLKQLANAIVGHGDDCDEFCRLYVDAIDATFQDGLVELRGAKWILSELERSGYAIAIFTNKRRFLAEKICHLLGFDAHLKAIVATDGESEELRKPSERFSKIALESIGAKAAESAMVGDTETDFQAALSGNFAKCYLVTTGMRGAEELVSSGVEEENIFPDLLSLGKKAFGLN
ncbi:MAG: HAD family hydrolase [Puniceicoccales bacterium]|nr:HAD family hydrolase [Puniceicoccales bacterium]